VRLAEWKAPAVQVTDTKAEGTHYLLYERQQHAQLQEDFERNVVLMRNETGVQDSGNLSFSFDPSYQQLILHRVQIHRGGRSLDRLDKAKIKIIQPESELNEHLLNGRLTALLLVEDLRVGDVLEYAFSRRGANPIFGGHFSTRLPVQSGVPVDRQRMRVMWSSGQPLYVRQHRTDAVPLKRAIGGTTEYLWDFTNLTAVAYEDFTPPGFEPFPYVELSDFEDWAGVIEWAVPLYQLGDAPLPAELRKLIGQWQRDAASSEESARLALQFVQDDLRYTGLELGPDSHRPAPPAETFSRRFGDCKGKTQLLCAILRAMKFEAWPALVNTTVREAVARRLPSPFAFNHVIVKLDLGGRTVWLDPTISYQGGELRNRFVSPLGKALVIQRGLTGLEDIPPPARSVAQQVISTFRIADYESPVLFTSRTIYRGVSADDMRERFARIDAKEESKNYQNFFARFYPGIGEGQPMEISDDRVRNVLTVTEHYQIKNLWKLDKPIGKWEAEFVADSFLNLLTDPSARLRQMPLRLPFPLLREQELVVELPDEDWRIPEVKENVEHAAFSFGFHRQLVGSTLRARYKCETRTGEIPVEEVASYLKKREEMSDLLSVALQRSIPGSTSVLARTNWLMVVVALFAFCAALIAGVWVWRLGTRPIDFPPLFVEPPNLQGLGGWLILAGFGLCIGPVVRAVHMARGWVGFFRSSYGKPWPYRAVSVIIHCLDLCSSLKCCATSCCSD
jgi:hypothetical protein